MADCVTGFNVRCRAVFNGGGIAINTACRLKRGVSSRACVVSLMSAKSIIADDSALAAAPLDVPSKFNVNMSCAFSRQLAFTTSCDARRCDATGFFNVGKTGCRHTSTNFRCVPRHVAHGLFHHAHCHTNVRCTATRCAMSNHPNPARFNTDVNVKLPVVGK